jgi:hypothetical protein
MFHLPLLLNIILVLEKSELFTRARPVPQQRPHQKVRKYSTSSSVYERHSLIYWRPSAPKKCHSLIYWRPEVSTNVTSLFIGLQQCLRTSQPYLLTSSSVYERHIIIYWPPAASSNVTSLFIDVQQRLRTGYTNVIAESDDLQQCLWMSHIYLLTSSIVKERTL